MQINLTSHRILFRTQVGCSESERRNQTREGMVAADPCKYVLHDKTFGNSFADFEENRFENVSSANHGDAVSPTDQSAAASCGPCDGATALKKKESVGMLYVCHNLASPIWIWRSSVSNGSPHLRRLVRGKNKTEILGNISVDTFLLQTTRPAF